MIDREELSEYIQQHPEAMQKEIAKHFECSTGSIINALKTYGIQYRRKPRRGPSYKNNVKENIKTGEQMLEAA